MSFYRNQLDLMIGYLSAVTNHASEASNSIEVQNKEVYNKELDADQFFGIFIEYIFFFLHLTYRRIYSLMEEREREMCLTQMADLAIRMAIDLKGFFLDEKIKHELYDKCKQDFIIAMSDYGKLPEYTEDEPVQMPLYWHFQKKVATLSGHALNPAAIFAIGLPLVVRVKDLNIDWFAKELVSNRFNDA